MGHNSIHDIIITVALRNPCHEDFQFSATYYMTNTTKPFKHMPLFQSNWMGRHGDMYTNRRRYLMVTFL